MVAEQSRGAWQRRPIRPAGVS